MESSGSDPLGWSHIIAEVLLQPLTFGVAFTLLVVVLLLVCSALISGAEVAFFSLGPSARLELQTSGRKSARAVLQLLGRPKRLLATILIANNLVNVAAIILASFATSRLFRFPDHSLLAFLAEVVAITVVLVLFGEIVPKVYATRHALSLATLMAYPLAVLDVVFRPVSWLLVSSTSFIDRRIKRKARNLSVDDLSHAFEITSHDDTTEEEQKMLSGIVRFGNIDVRQIMKSRVDVVAIALDTPFGNLLDVITEAGYSRIPVYEESFDRIAGILYVKDLLPYLGEQPDFRWQELVRKPFFVPASKKIDDLLKEFQASKVHLAIVVDEYGGTLGIVTLEDIIEEIVGEISDEFDDEELVYSRLDDRNFVFEGKILLKDMCRVMDVSEDAFSDVQADTLAGLILELEGRIPGKSHVTSYGDFRFRIESADRRKIIRVKVTLATGGRTAESPAGKERGTA